MTDRQHSFLIWALMLLATFLNWVTCCKLQDQINLLQKQAERPQDVATENPQHQFNLLESDQAVLREQVRRLEEANKKARP